MEEVKIRVTYGPNELNVSSGTAANVAELRQQVAAVFNIPESAMAEIDGLKIKKAAELATPITPATKEVNFVKESGSKAC
jgi:hypothetical protein